MCDCRAKTLWRGPVHAAFLYDTSALDMIECARQDFKRRSISYTFFIFQGFSDFIRVLAMQKPENPSFFYIYRYIPLHWVTFRLRASFASDINFLVLCGSAFLIYCILMTRYTIFIVKQCNFKFNYSKFLKKQDQ